MGEGVVITCIPYCKIYLHLSHGKYSSMNVFLFQLAGFIFSCVNIYMYGEDEESCKYIAQTSTYNRPHGLTSDTPTSTKQQGYQPVRLRDSWCLPTYVSYNGSLDWSNRGSSEYGQVSHDAPLLPLNHEDALLGNRISCA